MENEKTDEATKQMYRDLRAASAPAPKTMNEGWKRRADEAATQPAEEARAEPPANEAALRLTYAALADVADALADLVDTTGEVPTALAKPVLEFCHDAALRLKPIGDRYDQAITDAHERVRKAAARSASDAPAGLDVDDLVAALVKALVYGEPAFMDRPARDGGSESRRSGRLIDELLSKQDTAVGKNPSARVRVKVFKVVLGPRTSIGNA
jgi:hypothetical protein